MVRLVNQVELLDWVLGAKAVEQQPRHLHVLVEVLVVVL